MKQLPPYGPTYIFMDKPGEGRIICDIKKIEKLFYWNLRYTVVQLQRVRQLRETYLGLVGGTIVHFSGLAPAFFLKFCISELIWDTAMKIKILQWNFLW